MLKIEVYKGDITRLGFDALVNAANNRLWMGGRVAGALKWAGGEEIEAEAVKKGPIPIGESVSTGAGKLKARYVIHAAVMGQDLRTDAEKIRQVCQHVHQINTGKMCHLDAHMVGHALEHLQPPPDSLLFIENIGNLVCPAAFALGEHQRVVLISTPEGEDKPNKKYYDPRKWLREGEISIIERLKVAFEDLNCLNRN